MWVRTPQGISSLVIVGILAAPSAPRAACNLIPVAEKLYPSTLGSVTDPITVAGRTVQLGVSPCDASPGFEPVPTDNTVEVRFEPPGAGADTVVAASPASIAVADCVLPGGRCRQLTFATPDSTVVLPPYGLAGPARIVVRDLANAVVAEIGELSQPTFGCDREPETVFRQFTVVPQPNSFADVTSGAATEVLATVDGGGNILVPFDYWGDGSPAESVLAETPGAPVAIFLKGSGDVPAQGAGDTQTILEVLGGQANPSKFIRSFTPNGRPLPPLLRITETGELLGAADAVESVLRLARNDGQGGPNLYDLSDRLFMNRGPIVITAFSADRKSPIPLRSIRTSGDLVAYGREESREGVNLNADLDTSDTVIEVLDAATGISVSTGSAVTRTPLLQGQQLTDFTSGESISQPAVVTGGDLVAFLEYERDQNIDRNGDGDKDDSMLRVVERDGTDLVSGSDAIEVAPIGSFDGRALAVSGRRVFFRGPNPLVEVQKDGVGGVTGLAGAVDAAVSPDGDHLYVVTDLGDLTVFSRDHTTGRLTFVETENPALGSARAVAVSPDGATVYWTKPDGVVVYDRDDVTGAVTFLETHTDGVGGEYGLIDSQDITVSPDGENVYLTSNGPPAIAIYARDGGTGALTFMLAGGLSINHDNRVIVSPDGLHVYAGRELLDRSPIDGMLTPIGTVVDFGDRLAIAPDGRVVYDSSFFQPVVESYGRDPLSGALGFPRGVACTQYSPNINAIGCSGFADGVGDPPDARANRALLVSPDGSRLYARGNSHAQVPHVDVYVRNPETGALVPVASYYDGAAGVHDLGVTGDMTQSPDGRFLYATSATDGAVTVFRTSLNLSVYNADTDTLMAHHPPATSVAVAGERAIIMSNETEMGGDQNGDGDSRDEAVQIYDASGGNDDVINVGLVANRVAISDQFAAFTSPEASDGGVDYTADGDTRDDELIIYDFAADDLLLDGVAADRIAVSGDKVVFSQREGEGSAGDVNGDGDFNDRILKVYDRSVPSVTPIPLPMRGFAFRDPIVAFLVSEQGNQPLTDSLNDDFDIDDLIMHLYRTDTGEVFNTRQEGEGCYLPGVCPPLAPYAIDLQKQTVSFLQNKVLQGTSELAEDQTDLALQVFSIRSGTGQELTSFIAGDDDMTSDGLPAFPTPLFGDDVVFRPMREDDPGLNRDVNDDGVIDDTIVMVLHGDGDGDGTIDDFDTCAEASNPDGLDADGDGLGDSTCDPGPPCPATPLPGCRLAPTGKSTLGIKNFADDAKDLIKWKWSNGAATTLADIGNPVTGYPHYTLCVYDASGSPQPRIDAAVSAQTTCGEKPCWKAMGTKGFGYKDKASLSGGTQKVKLTSGLAGKAKAQFQGKGALLTLPPLPATLPVTLQLIVDEGQRRDCWTATYSTVSVNDATKGFKAKSD